MDLSEVLAANQAASYIDPATGQTRYQVFMGFSRSAGEQPSYVQADMASDGVFRRTFAGLADGPLTLYMYYVSPRG